MFACPSASAQESNGKTTVSHLNSELRMSIGKSNAPAGPTLYPTRLLSPSVGQCETCGRIMLQGKPLGEVLELLVPERPDEIDNGMLLRALTVHLQHLSILDCAVCWNRKEADSRRQNVGLSIIALLCERAASAVELLYNTPTYREAEQEQHRRLSQLMAALPGKENT